MKKILLLLAIAIVGLSSCKKEPDNSPIIQFDDFAFRDYLVLYGYDTNKDGFISEKEASNIKSLYIGSDDDDIEVIDKLQYFTSLKSLSIFCEQLTTLNVSGCTALEELHVHDDCKQLTEINASGCVLLTSLDVLVTSSGYNGECQLERLDVSNCTALIFLNCQNNQLTSLDVSGCTALETLLCPNNQLTSLDIRDCTALEELQCYNNQLSSLNVNACTALELLDCSDNRLTTINISKNTELTSLRCSNNNFQRIIMYKYHILSNYTIEYIQREYGDIIEYVE